MQKAAEKPGKRHVWFRLGLIILLLAAAVIYLLYDSGKISLPFLPDNRQAPLPDGTARVHFIDVGQGDCELIETSDGGTVLIDSGESDYGPRVINCLNRLGVESLDYIIISHPHSDHMGGMGDIINALGNGAKVILPNIPEEFIPVSYAEESLISALEKTDCEPIYAEDMSINIGGGTLDIWASDYSGENLNNYSPAVKFTFGEISFLFAGDMESDMEYALLEDGYDPEATVYKLSHHGSSTSNSTLWLAAVSPEYAVCECGAGNSYGHPHDSVIRAVEDYTDKIYRTDLDGTVIFYTDGRTAEVSTERQASGK